MRDIVVTDKTVTLYLTPDHYVHLYHEQDCCESVYVESVVGDIQDLIGHPLTLAEEASNDDPDALESGTWTFYKLATVKGYVDIWFYGSSNGYYSEGVSVKVVSPLDN